MNIFDQLASAFSKVRREDFLLDNLRRYSSADGPISIGYSQTNSQPTTVAFMLGLLEVKPGDRILDVGSGSGWTTALLAYLTGETGKVVGVEIIPQLVRFGQKNLLRYKFGWARIVPALEGRLGFPAEAPYNKILVSASARELPQELVDQLKIGGRMVVPVGESIFKVDKKADGEVETKEYPGFVFVPLR